VSNLPHSRLEQPSQFSWHYIIQIALKHKKSLAAAYCSITSDFSQCAVPLLMPLLVDEVLLDKPGMTIALINRLFPAEWHSPVLYISVILLS
jgi:ATP-binding cassette, subfamily C, bacterial